jgi:hypothetical protein
MIMESKKEKFRQTLDDLVSSGRFIPGIYNFCDRWCERCTLRHKCITYAHELEIKQECNDPETDVIDTEKFWEQIKLSFEVTLDMISEDAKRNGINLEELPIVDEPAHVESEVEELADRYGLAMNSWLRDNIQILQAKESQLLKITNNSDIAVKFADALEVVQWYCFYIAAKVHRSQFELEERLKDEADDDDALADNRGSAKIALIAVNRSIEALAVLYPELKEHEDEILKFLQQLSRIKKLLLVAFPTAMEFKRPGFDD